MPTFIGLFRGVNVGGANRLPMKELKELLEELGCKNCQTYIQSGNVVFQSPAKSASALAEKIGVAVKAWHGFEPRVHLLTLNQLQQAVEGNPFPEAGGEPKSLHLFFLAQAPAKPNLAAIEKLKSKSERFRLKDALFYLHAPDGIGRSKLAAGVERLLGVPATARNWRTVTQLLEMASACSP
jgi:uncharacterized protein (DUF1697 family)